MNPCNYNWNISILKLRKSHIIVMGFAFNPYIKRSFFNLEVEGQSDGLSFMKILKERNFRYIFIPFKIEISGGFKTCYYFDNVDNQMEMYFHKKE